MISNSISQFVDICNAGLFSKEEKFEYDTEAKLWSPRNRKKQKRSNQQEEEEATVCEITIVETTDSSTETITQVTEYRVKLAE